MLNNNKSVSIDDDMEIFYIGDNFIIRKKDNQFYMSWLQGPFDVEVCYKISEENAKKAMKSSKDAYEVSIYAVTGSWPSTDEERKENAKELIRNVPTLLLKIPKNRELFSKDELEVLLKKAKELENKNKEN